MCQSEYRFVLVVLLLGGIWCQQVPVYMWSNGKLESTPALAKLKKEFINNILSDFLEKDDAQVVAFVERYLSPEDFSQNKNIYHKMQKLKNEEYVSYTPSVENVAETIKKFTGDVNQLFVDSVFDNFSNRNILIVDLGDKKEETRLQMLKRHDSSIISIYEFLKKEKKNILAIYTSYSPSWSSNLIPSTRKSRYLLQDNPIENNTTAIVFKAGQILLYLSSNGTCYSSKFKINITRDWNFSSHLEEESFKMTATLTNNNDFKIIFNIIKKAGYWYISSIALNEDHIELRDSVYAPIGFSYHCASFNSSNNAKTAFLVLPGFQIQPFITKTSFGPVYDCVGFVTITILCVLLVIGLFSVSLAVGFTMLSNIKTMDRFDDPGKKTITVLDRDD